MKKKIMALLAVLGMVFVFTACSGENAMKDGYYTAEAAEFSHGWKEFVTITVKNHTIVSVEYNAKNSSGFIKSWDNAYMKNMKAVQETYPNEYTRNYAAQLIQLQKSEGVDAITGASTSGKSFQLLAKAVIEQAQKGDSQIITVKTE